MFVTRACQNEQMDEYIRQRIKVKCAKLPILYAILRRPLSGPTVHFRTQGIYLITLSLTCAVNP